MSDPNQPTVAARHDEEKADETEPDVHFEPVVKLEKVDVSDSESAETPIFKMRAKLFRFDKAATEWKERGTGEMKLLMHKHSAKVRVLMRRDKTLKICANHYITPEMKLNPNVGSDRSWVWTALADYSEEEVKAEMLAARFANADIAQRFKTKFEEAQKWNIALTNGTATPDSADCPKPDPDAVEAKPEEGSSKKATEETAAPAPVAAVVATPAAEEPKPEPVAEKKVEEAAPAPAAAEPTPEPAAEKPQEAAPAPAETKVEEIKTEEPAAAPAEPAKVEETPAAAPAPADKAVEEVTEALASHTIDAPAATEEKKEEPAAPAAPEEKKEEAAAPAPVEEKKEEAAAPAPVEEKKEEAAAPAPAEEKKEEAAPAAATEEKKDEAAPAEAAAPATAEATPAAPAEEKKEEHSA